jgi:hypothetical protein
MGDFLRAPGPGKWLALGLVLSLALNLFFGGVLAGRWMRPYHAPWSMAGGPPSDPGSQRLRGEWRERAAAVGEARQALRQQLIANPADKAAVDRASAKVIQQVGEAQAAMHRNLAEKAAAMTPEEREKFVTSAFERRGHYRSMRSDQPR